jgi:pimeloyl-ACP methyl ester carboxylesterase
MGGTGAIWRPIGAALEDDFDVLAPDQRGHGKSHIAATPGARAAPAYTPLDYGRDLVDTMSAQEFDPAWVVGHSMGVRSACALAHLKPDWVRGLVLVDLGFSGVAGGGLGEDLASFIRILPHRFATREEAREFMRQNCPDPAIAQYLMAVSVQSPQGVTFPFDHAALIETIQAARDVSVRGWVEEAGRRGTPVLVLRGAMSLVWSHGEFNEERQRFAAYASIRFEEMAGTGHGLPFEKRAEFVARLREFIAQGS